MTVFGWRHQVGSYPTVTVYERSAKGGMLYLRWWDRKKGNWVHRSLRKKLRSSSGRIVKTTEKWAQAKARKKFGELCVGGPEGQPVQVPLEIGDTTALIIHPTRGRYPVATKYRHEVEVALAYAVGVWGAERTWDTIERADYRELWRTRIAELRKKGRKGHRGAEVMMVRLATVVQWLQDEERIPLTAARPPRRWRDELRDDWRHLSGEPSDPEPARPRYTAEEMLRLIAVAPKVDPRFALLIALGAEQRLGQVLRAYRRHLSVDAKEFVVPSAGRKRGEVLKLTDGQMEAVRDALGGYLKVLEEGSGDYALFPCKQLPGGRSGKGACTERHRDARPSGPTAINKWWRKAEKEAGIAHVEGRAAYGVRRTAVDEAKKRGISREGLQAHGGWVSSQVPDKVYADQGKDYAREEARDVRASIRKENALPPRRVKATTRRQKP